MVLSTKAIQKMKSFVLNYTKITKSKLYLVCTVSNIFPPKILIPDNTVINRLCPERNFSQSWAFDYLPPLILYCFVLTSG